MRQRAAWISWRRVITPCTPFLSASTHTYTNKKENKEKPAQKIPYHTCQNSSFTAPDTPMYVFPRQPILPHRNRGHHLNVNVKHKHKQAWGCAARHHQATIVCRLVCAAPPQLPPRSHLGPIKVLLGPLKALTGALASATLTLGTRESLHGIIWEFPRVS